MTIYETVNNTTNLLNSLTAPVAYVKPLGKKSSSKRKLLILPRK
jgi:hypothetical protein